MHALTSCPALRWASTNDSTESAGITLSAELYMYNCGQLGCFDDNMLITSESLLHLNNIIIVRSKVVIRKQTLNIYWFDDRSCLVNQHQKAIPLINMECFAISKNHMHTVVNFAKILCIMSHFRKGIARYHFSKEPIVEIQQWYNHTMACMLLLENAWISKFSVQSYFSTVHQGSWEFIINSI